MSLHSGRGGIWHVDKVEKLSAPEHVCDARNKPCHLSGVLVSRSLFNKMDSSWETKCEVFKLRMAVLLSSSLRVEATKHRPQETAPAK